MSDHLQARRPLDPYPLVTSYDMHGMMKDS